MEFPALMPDTPTRDFAKLSKVRQGRELIRSYEEDFLLRIKDLFSILRKDYDLIFWYCQFLDLTGHLQFGLKLKTMDRYMRINEFIGKLQRELKEDDTLYVVSDHGMKPAGRRGMHTNHGFFSSSNRDLIEKPQELFYLLKSKME